MTELLENWSWLIKLAAIITSIAVVFKYILIPIKNWCVKIHSLFGKLSIALPILEDIAKDFKPNGGNSLRDVVNRIELRMDIIDERYKLLVELEDLGIFEADKDGRYTWVSEGWMKITNMSSVDASNFGWLAGVNSNDRGRVSLEWEMAITQERQFSIKYTIGENGSSKQILCVAFPLKDETGKLLSYVGRITNLNKF